MTQNPLESSLVFKITTAAQWRAAVSNGAFAGSRDDARDGFIHLSAGHQLLGTLAKHFSGQSDLMLIAFEARDLAPGLKWEPSRGGDVFPHLYTPLETRHALWAKPLVLDSGGVPKLPAGVIAC
jgi:uncharacterized protein (DUF952 family)